MNTDLGAFDVKGKDGRPLRYREGKNFDTAPFILLLQTKGYESGPLSFQGRHIGGEVSNGGKRFYVKLATTEGMSVLTENEHEWNRQFNQLVSREASDLWVPTAVDAGYYQDVLFYHVSDIFTGIPLATTRNQFSASPELPKMLDRIIDASEQIQNIPLEPLRENDEVDKTDHRAWFVEKATRWLKGIPVEVQNQYDLASLLHQIEEGVVNLHRKTRHGDFTPWHMMILPNGKLGLLDGEHALANSVEYYDIGYFIQRAYSVLRDPELAKTLVDKLQKRGYDMKKLQTVMLARAIGGFTDESVESNEGLRKPDYTHHQSFAEFSQRIA